MGCLNVRWYRVGEPLAACAVRATPQLRINCGIVCSVGQVRYLDVEPEYIFLMASNDFKGDVLVTSNVRWEVQ